MFASFEELVGDANIQTCPLVPNITLLAPAAVGADSHTIQLNRPRRQLKAEKETVLTAIVIMGCLLKDSRQHFTR
jgi:hypothetical protein